MQVQDLPREETTRRKGQSDALEKPTFTKAIAKNWANYSAHCAEEE